MLLTITRKHIVVLILSELNYNVHSEVFVVFFLHLVEMLYRRIPRGQVVLGYLVLCRAPV